jgi:hypothetical protein
MKLPGMVIAALVALLAAHGTSCAKRKITGPGGDPPPSGPPALHVDGRWIRNEAGDAVILRGVNIASLEWTSTGENVLRSLDTAAAGWKANLLRIPLSQDRWFGRAPEQRDGGRAYRAVVDALVNRARDLGVYLLLELHWSNAGRWGRYIGQHRMPDTNSVAFWKSLAEAYGDRPAVLFGLYNEPHDVSWTVWRDGGLVTETLEENGASAAVAYEAVGFQALADTVRAAGAAENILVVGGLDWGYDLGGVLGGYALEGTDIVYDTHCYPWKDANWNAKFGDAGRHTAILVGEWGGDFRERPSDRTYGQTLARYLRTNAFCWTAWCFHPSAGPCLILDWTYAPTGFGSLVRAELAEPVVIR